MVGKKKKDKKWRLDKVRINEVNEYKYLGFWLNRFGDSHAHVRHLCEKASGLHGLARKAKFWQGEEDIEAHCASTSLARSEKNEN